MKSDLPLLPGALRRRVRPRQRQASDAEKLPVINLPREGGSDLIVVFALTGVAGRFRGAQHAEGFGVKHLAIMRPTDQRRPVRVRQLELIERQPFRALEMLLRVIKSVASSAAGRAAASTNAERER